MRKITKKPKNVKAPQAPESPFSRYAAGLSPEQTGLLSAFFRELDAHCNLPKSEKTALRRDFEAALMYYANSGVSLSEALRRVDVANLGGFYVRPPVLWFPLDNAAKIYPLSMKRGQMAVFRLSVYLKAPVVPELLQMALSFTVKRFPTFATTVKKGFFWHYLDTSKRRYRVEPEYALPCAPIRVADSGSQSFRVLYSGRRVSVDFFHILTDGTGGMAFLKALTAEYLRLCGVEATENGDYMRANEVPSAREFENAFPTVDKTEKAAGFVDRQAVQLSGALSKSRPCRVLHFNMNAEQLKSAAKSHDATVTAYILARLMLAGKAATDELDGEHSIQVPVNMRKFYPSDTVRNFSMYCGIRLSLSEISDMGITGTIAGQLRGKSSKEAMSEMANSALKLVSALRFVPLAVKTPVAGLVYGFLGDKIFSNTFSNLGVVTLPPELAEHVEHMDFVLGTAITNRVSCSMVTFGNVATLTIVKLTADPSFEEAVYAGLVADGIEPETEGSL